MSDPRHLLGRRAEDVTADWLERAGWRILARRHRSPRGGEVDLVGEDPEGTLVAVEVRARRSIRTGAAATTVDGRRVARLGRTLAAFGAAEAIRHRGLRIDLVVVEPFDGGGERWRLRRIPGIG